MKKLVVVAIALFTFLTGVNAQDSFFEGIEKHKGQLFQYYYGATEIEGKEGHYILKDSWGHGEMFKSVLEVVKTESGLAYSVDYNGKDGSEMTIGTLISGASVDHYTYPSVFKHERSSDVHIFVDGMLIELKEFSDDGNFESIGRIAVLIKEVEEEEEKEEEKPKKKLTMKEKIAAGKQKMLATSAPISATPAEKVFMEINLKQVIGDYLKSMNEKQKTADPAKEAKNKAEIADADAAFLAKRQADSRDLAKKMNERDAKEGPEGANQYTVKNTTGSAIRIVNDMGSTTIINGGSSTTFLCHSDIYFVTDGATKKGSLITLGEDACGKTIEL